MCCHTTNAANARLNTPFTVDHRERARERQAERKGATYYGALSSDDYQRYPLAVSLRGYHTVSIVRILTQLNEVR
ncbi:unnamed protein product [Ceratitis capitata]|uniref:(Mediterranean fruit fly) hypothetical protein n=1 Tax=Ceratitis capitata TaxID=7213 RepID=A0A811VHH4_CERCA|nr:unnamed protein product [Ceratitis capitata]